LCLKGSKLYVEGALRTRKWQNKEGQDQYTTEIVASEMQMLDSRGGQDGGQGGGYQPPQQQQGGYQQPAAQNKPQGGQQQAPQQQAPQGMDSFDDDIPF